MQVFHDAIYGCISDALKMDTVRVEVTRVIGGGESPWAAVESLATATSKYGEFEVMSTRFRKLFALSSPPLRSL